MRLVALFLAALALALLAWRRRRAWRAPLVLLLGAGALACTVAAAVTDPFQVRKLLGAAVMPAGLVWFSLAALAWKLHRRRQRRAAIAAAGVWLLYTLAGNAWLGAALLAALEAPYAGIDPFTQGKFDAIVALGGGVAPVPATGRPALSILGDRAALAVRLFNLGRTNRLVATGPVEESAGGAIVSLPALTGQLWCELGVPVDRIVLLEGLTSTGEEVGALTRLLAERRWRRVGLITSAWHLRRTMLLCRRAGLSVEPLPADWHEDARLEPRNLIPRETGFRQVQRACWELLGAAVGR